MNLNLKFVNTWLQRLNIEKETLITFKIANTLNIDLLMIHYEKQLATQSLHKGNKISSTVLTIWNS
jgi:hypothetical protein